MVRAARALGRGSRPQQPSRRLPGLPRCRRLARPGRAARDSFGRGGAGPDTGQIQRGTTARIFGDIIRDEDYAVAASSQLGAESGFQDSLLFGRNEPALHHYHNTYREALGMEPLPLIEAKDVANRS